MAKLSQWQRQRTQIGALDLGIMLATLISAVIHIYLWSFPDEELRIWFLLNGIGYIVLLIAFYAPLLSAYRLLPGYALMLYTALTIVLYFFLGRPYDTLGLLTKALEVLLIVLIAVKIRRFGLQR
jgi:hypothetical protein